MATAYLTRSLSSTSTSWTFSAWVKRERFDLTNYLISWGNSGTDATGILFTSSGEFSYYSEAPEYNHYKLTSAKYRDVSGWYHVVCKCDAGAITLYVNGEEPTQSWSSGSAGQALDTSTMAIGKWVTSAYYHHGYMTHVNFVDGTAYAPTSFGQSDSNGVWIPKPSPSVTYGTNGFFLKMDNSGNMGLDSGGGSNNFTTSGTITQAKDTPSNVFATWNSLIKTPHQLVYSNGNTTTASGGNSWYSTQSTLGVTSGKWYWECKGLGADSMIGVASPTIDMNQSLSISQTGTTFFYNQDGGEMRKDASNTTADYGTLSTSDILGIAFDMDNKTITYYKNGVAFITNYAISTAITDTAMLSMNMYGGSNVINTNFGNGYFGTTAVTSAGANASDNGIFEYDVPTGYTALSTKGLNS